MAETRARSPRLGKGLSALLTQTVQVKPPKAETKPEQTKIPTDNTATETVVEAAQHKPGDAVVYLPIEQIVPNPDQPRKQFDAESLQGLSQSIKADGIMQPVIVRPGADDTFQIVAGERRWRASQIAELQTVPAIIRELSDQQTALSKLEARC